MKKGQRGFTLIELLLVIAIIGILAAIAVPRFSPSTDEAAKAKCLAQLDAIESAAELYRIDFQANQYPAFSDLWPEASNGVVTLPGGTTKQYFKRQPVCPSEGTYTVDANTGVAYCSEHRPAGQ